MDPFEAIQREDPSGKPWEPTKADYEAFEAWATRTYGADIYRAYITRWES